MQPTPITRGELIAREAMRWLNTPYHHAADVRGVGVDCAMLLVRVFCDSGLVPPFDPRPYPPDWHLHRSAERFLGWIAQFAEPVDSPQAGDVALFKYGRCVSHGGIVVSLEPEPIMIHAHMQAGRVLRSEVCAYADRLSSVWRVRA